jgi:glycerate-2-kinase
VKDGQLRIKDFTIFLSRFSSIVVLAVGKASAPMMKAALEILGSYETRGIIVAPHGERIPIREGRIQVLRAGHPIPDSDGLSAARMVLKTVRGMKSDELLLCLISGGASAMLPSPPPGVGLEGEKRLTQCLLSSNATIHEINTVRRHISTLKGGRLVEQCKASSILSLIVSDVPGNCLPDIASGLTVEDPTTYRDAVEVLKRHEIWLKMPRQVKDYLTEGLRGQIPETPKPGTSSFRRVRNFIIADNRTACTAAQRALRSDGVEATILSPSAEMEAREMGRGLASLATGYKEHGKSAIGSRAIIVGGETTVEVKGKGKGGRNQETVLWATEGITGLNGTVVAALGTDGVDGNSNAAGALADGRTAIRAGRKQLDPKKFLARNDSYQFFKSLNDGLVTSRTGTNVGDLYLMISLG